MEAEPVEIRSSQLSARVKPLGAELVSIRTASDYEILWQGNARSWAATAPILFPVVGRASIDNVIRYRGRSYPMPMHGFAATRSFSLAEKTSAHCIFQLDADEGTLAQYPFPFEIKIAYRVREAELRIEARIRNCGSEPMPFGFGFHPGFKWPMPGFGTKADHVLRFDRREADSMLGIRDGILRAGSFPNPLRNRTLQLDESMFAVGAMLFPDVESQTIWYGTRHQLIFSLAYENLTALALWTRPGGDFFCIEPWQSFPDLERFQGDIAEKSRLKHLGPGGEASYAMRIEVLDAVLAAKA